MATNKAKFKINASLADDRGYEAISTQVLTLQLEDATDVQWVRFDLFDVNDGLSPLASLNAPDLTFAGGVHTKTLSPADGTTTITMITNGADTHSWMLRATAQTDTGEHVYERIIALKNGKPRKTIPSEDTEWGVRGWSDAWNELVDYVTGVIGGGGYSTVQDEGVAQTQRNVMNFVGAGVTVTDVGSVTTITIPGSTVTGSAVGQTQVWNGSAWTAGALDLADGDARTGTLPAANGGTGIAGAGGTANRVLTTTDGSTWAAALVALATMVSGQLPLANLPDGTANSVLGRAAGTSGVMASIGASADGQVLRMAAGALAFGAVDLADTDAVTGLLPFANIADGSATSLFGRASGTTGVMASIAASADGQVLRRAAGVLAFGAVDLADTDAVSGLLPFANIADGSAASLFGRSAASGGVMASIASSADGQVLRRAAGVLGFGALDLADADGVTGLLPFANIASGTGLSVFGRSASTSGAMASIVGTDGQVLRVSGTTLGFGTIDAANITDGSITLAKLANGTAASVIGRSAATSGVYADIASSADGQVLRRSGGTLAWGAVDLADTDGVSGLLAFANVADGSATSVLGRAAGTTGVMASIAATADGQVLQRAAGTLTWATVSVGSIGGGTAVGQVLRNTAGNVPAWGALDLADADARTGLLPHANIANLTGLSVFGRSANTSGVMAAITGTDGLALRVSGTTLGFGTLATAAYADSSVTLAKLANATAASLLGRSANTGGVYADITSSADGQVLRRAAGALGFGALDLADADAVTGLLPFASLTDGAITSVLGRAGGTTGVMASIAATADGQFLQRAGGALTWAAISVGSIPGGTAVGQVLRNTAGNVPAWGAVDLADTDAVTGLLAFANLASGSASSVFGRSAASSGVMASIAGTAHQVLRADGSAVVGFGSLDLAQAATVGASKLALANIVDMVGLSVLGRSLSTTGAMGAITGTDGQVLRVSGTALGFGTIAATALDDNSIPLDKLVAAVGASVIGRAANTAGDFQELASSADGQVFRRAAGSVGWGALDLADADAVTGLLAHANVASLAGMSLFGRAANSTGVMAAITATADAQVLKREGTALVFSQLGSGSFADTSITMAKLADLAGLSVIGRSANTTGVPAAITATATGQVLRYSGTTIGFGALDLADADAVTGLLPGTNVNPNFGSQTVQTTGSALFNGITNSGAYAGTAGGLAVATLGDIRLVNGDGTGRGVQFADFAGTGRVRGLSVSTGNTLVVGDSTATHIQLALASNLSFFVNGSMLYQLRPTIAEIMVPLRFDSTLTAPAFYHEDDATTALATASKFSIHAQNRTGTGATVGAELELASGTGNTPGAFTSKVGSTIFLNALGTSSYPTSGFLRVPNNEFINFRSSGGTTVTGIGMSASDRIAIGSSSSAIAAHDYGVGLGGNFTWNEAGSTLALLQSSVFELRGTVNSFRFDQAVTSPAIYHEDIATTALATANKFRVAAQNRTGTGATVGAEIELASGTGATAGAFTMKMGGTTVYQALSTGNTYNALTSTFHKFQINSVEKFSVTENNLIAASGGLSVGTTSQAYPAFTWTSPGTAKVNLGLIPGSAPNYQGGEHVLYIGKNVTVPTANPANGIYAWVGDDAADGLFGLVTRSDDGKMRLGNGGVDDIELMTGQTSTDGVTARTGGFYVLHSGSNPKTTASTILTLGGGTAIGFATNSVAYLGYSTLALGASTTSNISLGDPTRTFNGGQGVIGIRNAAAAPTSVPASGGYIYTDSTGSLAWLSRLSTNGAWQMGPATTFGRKFFTPSCSTTSGSPALTQITSQTMSSLPSNCSVCAVIYVAVKDSTGQLGFSKVQTLFTMASGTITVSSSSLLHTTNGSLTITSSGASLLVSIFPTGSSTRSHECLIEVTWTTVP